MAASNEGVHIDEIAALRPGEQAFSLARCEVVAVEDGPTVRLVARRTPPGAGGRYAATDYGEAVVWSTRLRLGSRCVTHR